MGAGPERVIGADLDGVVFGRTIEGFFSHIRYMALRPSPPKRALADIPTMIHTPEDISVRGVKEIVSIFFHHNRVVFPGIAERFQKLAAEEIPIYACSGRKATIPWEEMTRAQLINACVPVTYVYLAPVGTSGLDSKADSIRQLRITEFYEDDKSTILFLARLFPDVAFKFIDHRISSLSKKDLAKNPNIEVIPIEEWHKTAKEESGTRNSPIRKVLKVIPETAAKGILKVMPDFNPNWLTETSVAATIVASIIAERRNRKGLSCLRESLPEAALLTIAQLLDWFDGSVARKKNEIRPGSHDTTRGGIFDTVSDRIGALSMAISRIVAADDRKDGYGKLTATLAGLTNPFPALFRARAEARGKIVAESGHDILDLFGTQIGRTANAIPATIWPNARLRLFGKDITLQNAADTIATIANLKVAISRFRGGMQIDPANPNKVTIHHEGKLKENALLLATGTTVLGVAATLAFLHWRESKRK